MDDLKRVTVRYLRELARKHLGPGHSKMTKEDLLKALAHIVPGLAVPGGAPATRASRPVRKEAAPARRAPAPAAKRATPVGESRPRRAGEPATPAPAPAEPPARKAARGTEPEPPPGRPAARKTAAKKAPVPVPERRAPARRRAAAAPAPGAPVPLAPPPPTPAKGAAPPPEPAPRTPAAAVVTFPSRPRAAAPAPAHEEEGMHVAEPLIEGFFVARVAGEAEARRHHLAEGPPLPPADQPGALPAVYGDDQMTLLPRDPGTLYATWDVHPATVERTAGGLSAPRTVLRVFEDDQLAHQVDVSLEARAHYLHGLPAGRPYRVELHLLGTDGRSRRLGRPSNRVFLPHVGPSPDTSLRFMRVPPSAAAGLAALMPAPVPSWLGAERAYVTWRRVALPGSAGHAEVPEWVRLAGAVAPPGLGFEWVARPPGASEQRPPDGGARPSGGASEQGAAWAGGRWPAGSSEVTSWWTPPRSGQG